MIEKPHIGSSGQLGQILLDGLEVIIGKSGVDAVLDQAKLFQFISPSKREIVDLDLADFAEIQSALEALYGIRGGQGTALRAGRVSFHCILQEYGEEMGLNDPEFRFHSTLHKIKEGLRVLAEKFSELISGNIYVSEDETAWIWHVDCEPSSSKFRLLSTCNPFILGFLQEFIQWVTGGKHFLLDTVKCNGMQGEAVRIRIEKQAID